MTAAEAERGWEARAHAGWMAFREGRIAAAQAAWRAAAMRTRTFAPGDPRRAASRTNLALCHAATGADARARRSFRRSLCAWDDAEAWVARMAVGQRARSSSFHLRLASKHAGGYDAPARGEFARLLGAGRAAALAGGAHLAKEPAAALEEARVLREAGLGYREAGLAVICRALAAYAAAGDGERAAAHRHRAAEIARDPVRFGPERLAAECGAEAGDLGRLKAAVYLTPVVLRPRARDAAFRAPPASAPAVPPVGFPGRGAGTGR